jgi:hypothetical protein
VDRHVPRRHVHHAPSPPAQWAREGPQGVPSEGASADGPHQGADHAADRAGPAPAEAGRVGVLRRRRGALPAARPGPVEPAAAARPLDALGPAGLSGAAPRRRGPAVGLEHGHVSPRPVASALEPRVGDGAAPALLRRAGPAQPDGGLTPPRHPPHRRRRAPSVRWCGRAGAARPPLSRFGMSSTGVEKRYADNSGYEQKSVCIAYTRRCAW